MPFPSSIKLGLAAGLASIAPGSAVGAPVQQASSTLSLSCPPRLDTEQKATAVPGWSQYRSVKGRLASTGFYDGDVSSNFELRPNGGGKRGKIVTNVHRFIANKDAVNFVCRYQGTDIVLSRALPRSLRQCTVTSDEMSPAATDVKIVCS